MVGNTLPRVPFSYLFSPGLHSVYFKTKPENSAGAADLPAAQPFHVTGGKSLPEPEPEPERARRGRNLCTADHKDRKQLSGNLGSSCWPGQSCCQHCSVSQWKTLTFPDDIGPFHFYGPRTTCKFPHNPLSLWWPPDTRSLVVAYYLTHFYRANHFRLIPTRLSFEVFPSYGRNEILWFHSSLPKGDFMQNSSH